MVTNSTVTTCVAAVRPAVHGGLDVVGRTAEPCIPPLRPRQPGPTWRPTLKGQSSHDTHPVHAT